MNNMPKELFWNSHDIGQIEGFGYFVAAMDGTAAFRSGFEPRNDGILLTSFTKTGTTWLKVICYNILDKEAGEDLLAEKNPHEVVPALGNTFLKDQIQRMLLSFSSPRLLHTHLPYSNSPVRRARTPLFEIPLARFGFILAIGQWQRKSPVFLTLGGTLEFFNVFVLPNRPCGIGCLDWSCFVSCTHLRRC
ncbi:unnamed protein product [Linum tenue]|uniref:Sulfotransferase n=1 Tax=Linum tenue TaxID=586396 RepID=A0AAV0GZ34_9ROSI|nr:unnamed protein product [Linum tenue]